MRIGKWVPLYNRMLPIPRRLAMAFGLHEGSELHLVPLGDAETERKFGCEVMVSPIPLQSWRSVCRLSVRLLDRPGALTVATRFLREHRINILLSECCSTYQQRAHWDAICDLAHMQGFDDMANVPRSDYERKMKALLAESSKKYLDYTYESRNQDVFLRGAIPAVEFTPLTGLNDAEFVCRHHLAERVVQRAGAVELPERLSRHISKACKLDPPNLPQYAMITGNTEQRYLRVLFLKDHSHMFRLIIDDDLRNFAAGGVGVLHQVLEAMPPNVNLMRAANYVMERRDDLNRGRIDLIGHWDAAYGEDVDETDIEQTLRNLVSNIVLTDADGKTHAGALTASVTTAKTVYPKVFVSYSTGREREKLEMLINALAQNNYEPVLGTNMGAPEPMIGSRRVGQDVLQASFSAIEGCVAFVSLQVRRDDFRIPSDDGTDRYILPPWSVAEEVYAWSAQTRPFIIRLRDRALEDPQYNRHTLTKTFRSGDPESFREAVDAVINALNEFRASERFARLKYDARRNQFREFYTPRED